MQLVLTWCDLAYVRDVVSFYKEVPDIYLVAVTFRNGPY